MSKIIAVLLTISGVWLDAGMIISLVGYVNKYGFNYVQDIIYWTIQPILFLGINVFLTIAVVNIWRFKIKGEE